MFLLYLALFAVFVSGMTAYVLFPRWSVNRESFEPIYAESKRKSGESNAPSLPKSSCPNLLIRHGKYLMLYNGSMLVERFSSLEEYIEYMENNYASAQTNESNAAVDVHGNPVSAQRCPVLFLSPETTAQGEDLYMEHPDPYQSTSSKSESNPEIRAFDAHGYDADATQPAKKEPEPAVSDNPMATNWGGVIYSQQAIDTGKYDRRTVGKPTTEPGSGDIPVI